MTDMISIDDFAKIEIRVGKVTRAENVEGSDKLIRLTVDFSDETRTIFTGVRVYGFTPEDFTEKQFLFCTNLETKKMMGEESQGMILAVDGEDEKPIFVSAEAMPLGAKVR